jgi:ABC-2 type transport system permease protein
MTSWFDLNGFGQFALGLGITIYSATKIGVHWSLLKVLLFFVTLISSSLTLIAIVLAGTSLSFWIVNANSLTLVFATVRDFGRYPLTIFKGFFRFLFTYLIPIGFIAFYPAQLLLRPVAEINIAAYFSPIVGLILFALAYAIWKKGVNIYSGTGT